MLKTCWSSSGCCSRPSWPGFARAITYAREPALTPPTRRPDPSDSNSTAGSTSHLGQVAVGSGSSGLRRLAQAFGDRHARHGCALASTGLAVGVQKSAGTTSRRERHDVRQCSSTCFFSSVLPCSRPRPRGTRHRKSPAPPSARGADPTDSATTSASRPRQTLLGTASRLRASSLTTGGLLHPVS
jgi:hypothetical protein